MKITRLQLGLLFLIAALYSSFGDYRVTGTKNVSNSDTANFKATTDSTTGAQSPVAGVAGQITDRSVTLTAAGTAQTAAIANPDRRYLLVQVPTTGTKAWLSFNGSATQGSPSIELPPGSTYTWEGSFVPTQAVSINGAVTGQAITVKEGQ